MDSERFDALARRLATEGTSRRRLLRGMGGSLAGAALAALGIRGAGAAPGGNSACAQWCHEQFSGREAGQCTSEAARGGGACYSCAGGPMAPARPSASDQCHDVACNEETGQWVEEAKPDGISCNGDLCFPMTCQAGVCVSGDPVVCEACDQCHDAGPCDPATGVCSDPPKTDGSACDGGNACTANDTCQDGVCTSGDPVVCEASDQCHDAICDPAAGCLQNRVTYGTACDDGNPLCINELCCTAGYEVVNGGCFKIVPGLVPCNDCPEGTSCSGSISGSSNYLCISASRFYPRGQLCKSSRDCPSGTVCQIYGGTCHYPS